MLTCYYSEVEKKIFFLINSNHEPFEQRAASYSSPGLWDNVWRPCQYLEQYLTQQALKYLNKNVYKQMCHLKKLYLKV